MKATFIKAEPTKDGITLVLKAEKSKENMRLAVELLDEECFIDKSRPIESAPPIEEFCERIKPMLEELLQKNNLKTLL